MSEKIELAAVVVCGGQSSRMGSDKSMLIYHGQPQWQYLYEMLSRLCKAVYLSVNAGQVQVLPQDLPLLQDLPAYRDKGPIAALLTAFERLPCQNILLIGCDYPFLQQTELEHFLHFTAEASTAAAFYNEQHRLYEPLLAFYPQEAADRARALFATGNYALQSLLRQLQARKYVPEDAASITSADTEEQYRAALKWTDPGAGFKKED